MEVGDLSNDRKLTKDEIQKLAEANKETEQRLRAELDDYLDTLIREQLTVEQRLMRRHHMKLIQTKFEDEIGEEIVINTRRFTDDEMFQVDEGLRLLKDSETTKQGLQKLKDILKEVDESMSPAFWDSQYATMEVVTTVVLNTLYAGVKEVSDKIDWFRQTG